MTAAAAPQPAFPAPRARATAIRAHVLPGSRLAAAWLRAAERGAWLLLEPFLPGATLFLLLVILMTGYVRHGFASVRQHAFAPDGGKWVANASTRRRWWNCPCASAAACTCAQVAVGELRRTAQDWLRSLCGGCLSR